MQFQKILFTTLFLFCSVIFADDINDNPVIGILTMPSDGSYNYSALNYSFLPSSYVKQIWAAGARVVYIPYEADENKIKKIFASLNGIFFTGGGV